MSLAAGHHPSDVACAGALRCLVCRLPQSVVGTPVATARIAADRHSSAIEVELTGVIQIGVICSRHGRPPVPPTGGTGDGWRTGLARLGYG
jgi:hypothetical protein